MKKIFTLIASAMVALSGFAQTTHQEWEASQLASEVFATVDDAVAAGFYTIWSSPNYLGTPANYELIAMPEGQDGISAKLEYPSYVSVGGKCSGKDKYAYKLIMGMNNSTRDGLDASVFDATSETCLADCGYLRKAANADQDATVEVKDAIVTIEVGANAQQGRLSIEHNRGGNNYSLYVIDATKNAQVLMTTPRCPDGAMKTHVSTFNVYPGRKYYIIASDKGSVELYKIAYDNVTSDTYEVNVPENCQQSWTASQIAPEVFTTQDEAVAAGFYTIWSSPNYLGTPANYELIAMPETQDGISAKLEYPSYVSVGGKCSGKDLYPYKVIMGMNNSTRDGLDASVFDATSETCLDDCGYLRKAANADQDATVEVKDAIVTIEVGANAEQGQIILEHNRGGNNYSLYVIDATKQQQVLMSTPRCPDTAMKTHVSIFNVYPGRKYYVIASDKGSVELYGIHYNNVSADAYVVSANPGNAGGDPNVEPGEAEKWSVIASVQTVAQEKEDGTTQYVIEATAIDAYATLGAEGEASIVKIEGKNFTGEHVSGPVADFINAETLPLEKKYDNTWSDPKAQGLSATGTIAPLVYMQGKGNPANLDLVTFEEITKEGEPTGVYRAYWEDSYYNPDGSTQGPKNGTYLSLIPKADGFFKVGVWVNKGNRDLYVCPNTDYKALAFGTDVKVSGYVQATTWTDEETADPELLGQMKFQDEIKTKAALALEADPTATPAAGDYYIIGAGNRPVWAWLTFDAKKDVTYYIFNKNTQVGLMDVEFTAGVTAIETVETVRPAVVKTNIIYNLAGQRVGADYKGIVIKNGKKVMMK